MQFKTDRDWVYPISIVLYCTCILFMLSASTTNPGFIPRQLSHFAKGPLGAQPISVALASNCHKSSPFMKKYFEFRVNGAMVKMKYCDTCIW
jgi:hypothetical protein